MDFTVTQRKHSSLESISFIINVLSCQLTSRPTDPNVEKLVSVNEEAVMKAISVCGPGVNFRQIGSTIEYDRSLFVWYDFIFSDVFRRLASQNGFSIAEDAFGHGIGRQFHQHPFIAHFANSMKGVMRPGMAFTIGILIFCEICYPE